MGSTGAGGWVARNHATRVFHSPADACCAVTTGTAMPWCPCTSSRCDKIERTAACRVHMTYRSASVLAICVLLFDFYAVGPVSARTFGGYDCTNDCVGHAAGYRWAEERGIEYIDEWPENRSEAFYEGCITYVDDPERGADVDDDGQTIPRRSFMSRRISLTSGAAQSVTDCDAHEYLNIGVSLDWPAWRRSDRLSARH
jgi:hypothetical protein